MTQIKHGLNYDSPKVNGELKIYLKVYHKSQKKLFSSGYSIHPDFWDDKNGKVLLVSKIKSHPIPESQLHKLKVIKSTLDGKIAAYELDLVNLQIKKPNYTFFDVLDIIEKKKESSFVLEFIDSIYKKLTDAGKMGNAWSYKSTYNALYQFRNGRDLTFEELDYRTLLKFEEFLYKNRKVKPSKEPSKKTYASTTTIIDDIIDDSETGNPVAKRNRPNTIFFYMKTLRAVYNRAIKEELVEESCYPYKTYKLKREKTIKRAIVKGNIADIKNLDLSHSKLLSRNRDIFMFSFYTRGMSFVDISFLKVSNIVDERIFYSRNKTGQKFSILITPQIKEIILKYNDLSNADSYIFPIIKKPDVNVYRQYRTKLVENNLALKNIGKMINLNVPLTSYVSRHSWATIAKRSGVPTAIISEGLGHETERTTQIYLDSFENSVLDEINSKITDI